MSTDPTQTPRVGSCVTIETPSGDERRATVRRIEPAPQFNDLDRRFIHVRCSRTDLKLTPDEIVHP